MQTVQPFNVRPTAARAIADLRRSCDALFLGHRAEIEEKLALAQHDDDPAIADRALSEIEARIQAQADRIAAEEIAFRRAPLYRRRTDAGICQLLVERGGVEMFVPLCELTSVELDAALGDIDARIAALPPAAPAPDAIPVRFDLRRETTAG